MDWKTTALVVIDMENAFISKESPLCIQEAAKSVPACGRVIRKARERGIPVFFVNRIYRRNGSDVEFTRYEQLAWRQSLPCTQQQRVRYLSRCLRNLHRRRGIIQL